MKILVAVKEVASIADDFEIDGVDIDPKYLEYDLNEWDAYAIEEAVQISEANDDVEVVSVTIGPSRAEETVRMGLAKGVDRAIRVWDDTIAESVPLDIHAKAELLAAVVDAEDPDLILTGVQSSDESNGATGVYLAHRIGFEWAAVVNNLEMDIESNLATVRRELEGGVEEMTGVETPAVLTIQSGINEPRYASLRGIRQAQSKPLAVWTLGDIEVDPTTLQSPLQRKTMSMPESEADAVIWEGEAEDTAGELASFLRDTGVVEG